MELLYDRLRKDNFTDAILTAARVVHPGVVQPTPLDTHVIAGEVYLRYPKVPDSERMTAAALTEFVTASRLAATQ